MLGFEFGCRGPLLVREERVLDRVLPETRWRVLYASDLHFTRRRAHLTQRLVDAITQHRPDVVALGGDLVDRRNGIEVLAEATAAMARHVPVVAVGGNHDARFGLAKVRAAVVAGGGSWLHDAAAQFSAAGRRDLRLEASPTAATVLGDAGSAVRVLVAHRPEIAAAAAERGYDLVLAGHLHGGQCVLWSRGTKLYPGAWLSRWNGLRFELGSTALVVSRGAADTLPVRFRCPREVVLCELG